MKLTGKLAEESLETLGGNGNTKKQHMPARVWVMVSDMNSARIFKKDGKQLAFLGAFEPTGTAREDLSNGSIGNVAASSGGSLHHQYAPHMNASRHDELLFTREVAGWLDDAVAKNSFDRLVLVSPPQMLGEFRRAFSKRVTARIMADMNKDLTKMPVADIQLELSGIVGF